jgi:hypothetical protein
MDFPFEGIPTVPPRKDTAHMVGSGAWAGGGLLVPAVQHVRLMVRWCCWLLHACVALEWRRHRRGRQQLLASRLPRRSIAAAHCCLLSACNRPAGVLLWRLPLPRDRLAGLERSQGARREPEGKGPIEHLAGAALCWPWTHGLAAAPP